jgi:hypothetical protein
MILTREDLNHNPKSGLIDLAILKQAEQAEIDRHKAEYFAKGGKIQKVELGKIADWNPIRKEKFDNSLKKHNMQGLKTL